VDTLSYKTISANNKTVERKWHLIDAKGQIVGRLATRIATILRGKDKPYFTPHVDCGDYVIVINAKDVVFTGKKWDDKKYLRYSGYPGGLKSKTAKQVASTHPERILQFAVKGMIPKNKLGNAVIKKMFIYNDEEHPHSAQNPKKVEL